MKLSVVIHHNTAWCRSQVAISRCTSGSDRRQRSTRGGKRVAWATPFGMMLALSKLLPDQKTQGQHHRHGMSVKTRPQATLILIPAQLPLGFFMELLDRMATMGIFSQFLQRRLCRQIAPVELAFLRLAACRPLAQQPTDMRLAVRTQAPGAQRDKLLAQPAFSALSPTDGAPLAPWHRCQCLIGPLTGRHG